MLRSSPGAPVDDQLSPMEMDGALAVLETWGTEQAAYVSRCMAQLRRDLALARNGRIAVQAEVDRLQRELLQLRSYCQQAATLSICMIIGCVLFAALASRR